MFEHCYTEETESVYKELVICIKTEDISPFMFFSWYCIKKGALMKEVNSIKRKRICKFLRCKHVLSIYNPGAYCYVHQKKVDNEKSPTLSSVGVR